MNLPGLISGAGVVAGGYRTAEEQIRKAEEQRLKLQQMRLEQAARDRAEQARRSMPRADTSTLPVVDGALPPAVPTVTPGLPALQDTTLAQAPRPPAPQAAAPSMSREQAAFMEANVTYPPVGSGREAPTTGAPTPVAQATTTLRDLEDRKVQLLRDLREAPGGGRGRAAIQAQIDEINRQIAAARSGVTQAQRTSGLTPPAPPAAPAAPAPAAPAPAAPAPAAPAASDAARRAQDYDSTKTRYDDLIRRSAEQAGIDPVVFKRLIGTESSFKPNEVSPRGREFGLGIAQISAVHGLSDADRLNPEKAIPFAAQLFSRYLQEAGGNYEQAILRYKGAVSPGGRQAMAAPVATILSGIATTAAAPPAAAAPAAAAPPAAAAGAPAAPPAATPGSLMPAIMTSAPGVRATAPVEPVQAMEFYRVNPGAITADQRYANETYTSQRQIAVEAATVRQASLDRIAKAERAQLVGEYNALFNAGQTMEANAVYRQITALDAKYADASVQNILTARAALVELDNNFKAARLVLAGSAAAAQLEYQNNPAGAAQMLSYVYGQPIQLQPVDDGTFRMLLPRPNGELGQAGVFSRAQVLDMVQSATSQAYRAAKAEMSGKAALERLKGDVEVTKQQAMMIREMAVESLQGSNKAREIMLQGQKYDAKPVGDGSGTILLFRSDGTQAGIIRPNIGQKVPGPDGTQIDAPPTIMWLNVTR